jgi:hypothetical protein
LPSFTHSGWARRVLYVDTHAGRGRYESGDPGSPVLALQTLLRPSYREKLLNASELNFPFIERAPANLAALEAELCQLKPFPARVNVETSEGDAAKTIQDKLDRLDEAFLFERSIDIETYDRHAEKLREELTLARIDRHSGQLDELDVEGILAFAERVLPRAADLWVQASLEQRQRFQQLFFPDGIAFDGNRFVRTGVTAPAFSYLRPIEGGNEGLVAQTGIEPLPTNGYSRSRTT